MIKKVMIGLIGLTLAAVCTAMVSIPPAHREDVATPAQVLAEDARNLEGAARGKSIVAATLAESLGDLNTAARSFAVEAERGTSQNEIDNRYVALIQAWVRVKLTFPADKAEGALKQSYEQVVKDWEALSRATGYAGQKYEEKYGTK